MGFIQEQRSMPQNGGQAITPNDSTELDPHIVAICATVGGVVAVVYEDDSQLTWPVVAGIDRSLYGVVKKVKSTGTTATGLVGVNE